jgi:hypothetical protein
MRDYRDAKAMAKTLRAALAAKGVKISIGDSLELIAKALGAPDWNTLAAAIKAAPKDEGPPDPKAVLEQLAASLGPHGWDQLLVTIRTNAAAAGRPPNLPAAPDEQRETRQHFSPALEASLHRSVALATARSHRYTTLEHLLLALIDDPDAAAVLEACRVDLARLRGALTGYLDEDLKPLVRPEAENAGPTAGFHRVVQRAVIHVQSSGRAAVTGANLLVAIFSEPESAACRFLTEQKMTRFDAVNFIAHGVRKGEAAA